MVKLHPIVTSAILLMNAVISVSDSKAQNEAYQDEFIKKGSYLSAKQMPLGSVFLPPPAPFGSHSRQIDIDTYEATRAYEGSPRWALAIRDAEDDGENVLKNFSCAVGFQISKSTTPSLYNKLINRVTITANTLAQEPKNYWNFSRPFAIKGGRICTPQKIPDLIASPSYP